MTSLTADAVLMTKFQPTRFREGYDQDQVDDFLDTVTEILRSYEAGGPLDAVAAAELCRTARFQPTKLREGYDQQQVDALLARLAQQFGALAGGASPVAGAGGASPVARAGGASPVARAGGASPVARAAAAPPAPPASGPRPGEYQVARRPGVGTIVGVIAAVAALAVLVWQYAL
ncbi:DivIVA domain-containing protein [Georgenia daeguensis]|uniref:DivIVA domain-containing protein n=1 Tax=Georgenia daeguensis TaxID=908355 RepID=A0ABP8EXT0_9MICO